MSFFKKPLSPGEIVGYFVSLAGFVVFQVRGPHDALVETAVVIIVLGAVIAARTSKPS